MPHTFAHSDWGCNSGNESLPKQTGKETSCPGTRVVGRMAKPTGRVITWNLRIKPTQRKALLARDLSPPWTQPCPQVLDISVMSANRFSFAGVLFWIGITSLATENILTDTEEQGAKYVLMVLQYIRGKPNIRQGVPEQQSHMFWWNLLTIFPVSGMGPYLLFTVTFWE